MWHLTFNAPYYIHLHGIYFSGSIQTNEIIASWVNILIYFWPNWKAIEKEMFVRENEVLMSATPQIWFWHGPFCVAFTLGWLESPAGL